MKKSVVAAAAGVLVLTGCGGPETGEVVDKDYSPAFTTTTSICSPVGNVTVCTPQTHYYPESWDLRLKNGDDEGWVGVSEETYNRCEIGFDYPEDC